MPENIRTFIAVRVEPSTALREVHGELKQLGKAIKPVEFAGMHITLKFLGGTDSDLVPLILDGIRESTASESPFTVNLRGLGAFPNKRRPSVVWAGIENGEVLAGIAERLETTVEPLGFARETRPYNPHLTLARIRNRPPPGLEELFEQHAATEFGTVNVDAVKLYQSVLSPTGARYKVVGEVRLDEG